MSGLVSAERRVFHRSLVAVGAIVAVLWTPVVWAHAGIVKFEPGRRAALKASPHEIAVTFTEAIEPAYSSLTLLDSHGKEPPHGKAQVDPGAPRRLVMPVDPLAPGAYKVRYRVLSQDGHVVSGEYGFSVEAGR